MGEVSKILDDIKSDNLSGASVIATKAAHCLVALTRESDATSPPEFIQQLSQLGQDLISAQPRMAPLFNLVNCVLRKVEALDETRRDLCELKEIVSTETQQFIANSATAMDRLAQKGSDLIRDGMQIITYSYSNSVAAVLTRAYQQGRKFEVIATEARPMYEGRALAKYLADQGIPITLIVDAGVSYFMTDVNMVLVGADTVTEQFIVNKIGTQVLALLARQNKIPVYVACELSKFISSRMAIRSEEERNPEEVWEENLPGVTVKNIYFEEIPLEWFDAIITEEGLLRTIDVKKRLESVQISKLLGMVG